MARLAHQEFRAAALGAARVEQSWELTCAYLAAFGFDGVFLADLRGGMMSVRSNIDAAWARHAADEGVLHADPFFAHCFKSYDMMRTGADYLHRYQYLNPTEIAFIRTAEQTGLRAGISMPARLMRHGGISGWHLLSSHGANAVEGAWNGDINELRLSLLAVHHRLIGGDDTAEQALSPRERDCLLWCAEGARNAVIADRIGISESTVEFHLRNARKKLGARTREQAIAIGIRQGLIH